MPEAKLLNGLDAKPAYLYPTANPGIGRPIDAEAAGSVVGH